MGIEAIVARTLQILLALGGAYLIALWFVLIVWTYRDIESRSRNVVTQVFSTILPTLFWIPGVLLYMILRPKETLDGTYQRSLEEEYLLQDLEELPLCPSCERYVEGDFVLCPHCHTRLREPCLACARLIDLRWSICPYCSAAQGGEAAGKPERVEAPAARWRASGKSRRSEDEVAAMTPARDAAPVEDGAAWSPADDEVAAVAVERRGSDEDRSGETAAASAQPTERREPIPLVPVPRGRFRRAEPGGPDPIGVKHGTASEPVPTKGLLTSILGSRSSENGRSSLGAAKSRRALRETERTGTTRNGFASIVPTGSDAPRPNGHGHPNGQNHEADHTPVGTNGTLPSGSHKESEAERTSAEPVGTAHADGKGD